MKTLVSLMLAGALVIAFGQSGYAQVTPPATTAPAAPKAAPAPANDAAARKAKAKECSAKATAQGLHGKARKEFREKCKKGE
ncbi:MAG TPA: PsiF family protein [Methylocella sp.]|nr:PsiF family protein [Methylocella sp.]